MIFSVAHILLTAAITSALALIAAFWRLPRSAWLDILAITVLSGVAVLLWRLSANMPQLNDDGLPGFSCGCRTGHPPHATWEYSWINPPSRSRRRTRSGEGDAGGGSGCSGAAWSRVR